VFVLVFVSQNQQIKIYQVSVPIDFLFGQLFVYWLIDCEVYEIVARREPHDDKDPIEVSIAIRFIQ
jgi:hypothetical protein